MKQILMICAIISGSIIARAENIKLKITYHGEPVQKCDVTVRHGDVAIANGRTDSNGEVEMSGNLMSKSIDVSGRKQTSNGEKTWDINGYVTLDNNNFAHMKMEVYAQEMAEASGGFLSESSIAAGWGLVLGGDNKAEDNSSTASRTSDNSTSSNTSGNNSSVETRSPQEVRNEQLQQRKESLEGRIANLDRKIGKNQDKISDIKNESSIDSVALQREEIDMKINYLKKEKAQLDLDETNAELSGNKYNKDQRKANKARKEEIDIEIKSLKGKDQSVKEEGKKEDLEENFDDKSLGELKRELPKLKMRLKKAQAELKMKGKMWSDEKKAEQEEEIEYLEDMVKKYEDRIEELEEEKAEKEK